MKLRFGTLLMGFMTIPGLAFAQSTAAKSSEVKDAAGEVKEATSVVQQMQKKSDVAQLLDKAQGVFILPDYGRAALGIGGSGGQGVLLARHDGTWSDPVFYNVGSVSLGLQAGVSAGQVAMILMTPEAVNSFKGNNTFSLNADAELTIINYSARTQGSLGKADVVFWSDAEGAYAGGSLSASAISADGDANRAYYGRQDATPDAIMSGRVTADHPETASLKQALA
jgi:lipid-binding SYLF domain-containing protein